MDEATMAGELVICEWAVGSVRFRALPLPEGAVRVEFRTAATLDMGWSWMFDAAREHKGYLRVTRWHHFDADVDAAEASIVGRAQHEIAEARERMQSAARRRRAAASEAARG